MAQLDRAPLPKLTPPQQREALRELEEAQRLAAELLPNSPQPVPSSRELLEEARAERERQLS